MVSSMSVSPESPILTESMLPPRAVRTSDVIFRLSVQQYHDMIEAGTLSDEDPVEMIEGVLVYNMPKKRIHAAVTQVVRRLIETTLSPGLTYETQEPITLADGEPEPDGVVVRGGGMAMLDRHPGPEDVALVIEVADTSLARDRGTKLRSYARARIGVYVIVNLIDMQIEVYHNPQGEADAAGYDLFATITRGQSVTLPGEVKVTLNGDEVLPSI
jgi:Putative restriction endonuclease